MEITSGVETAGDDDEDCNGDDLLGGENPATTSVCTIMV
jgi:hypothetical protein